jgi:cytochrome c-type biogenesis protein CcmH
MRRMRSSRHRKRKKRERQVKVAVVPEIGDFVLYRPPLKASTWLLWFGPPLVLLVGLVMLMRTVRERRKRIEREPLSASEHAEAEHLLSGDGEGERK